MTASSYNEFGWRDAQPMFYHKLLGKYIERLLPTDGSPILDVGCGNGYFANYLAEKGYCVYGIDASEQGIAIANRMRGGEIRSGFSSVMYPRANSRPNCAAFPSKQ